MTALQRKLDNYSNWRHDLLTELEAYKSWLDDEDLLEGEEELRVLELIDSIKSASLKGLINQPLWLLITTEEMPPIS